MPVSFRTLAQARPAAGVLTDVYTAPTGGFAVISTLSMCNTGDLATTLRVRLAPAGAVDAEVHAIYHDVPIAPGDTIGSTTGLTLGAGEVLRVQSVAGTVSFTLSGQETTS